MELTSNSVEITKELKLADFLSYKKNEELAEVLHVDANCFSSRWLLSVEPLKPDGKHKDHTKSIDCNVKFSLNCQFSSSPILLTRKICISLWIKGREISSKDLSEDFDSSFVCFKTVIPRSVILPYISDGSFYFYLKFCIPNATLSKSINGVNFVNKGIRNLFKSLPKNADVELITSDGRKLYAHSIILDACSNLLKTSKFVNSSDGSNSESCFIKTESDLSTYSDTPIKTEINRDELYASFLSNESSSVLDRLNGSMPMSRTPTKRQMNSYLSPCKKALFSPKHSLSSESPRKSTQTQLTNYFVPSPQKLSTTSPFKGKTSTLETSSPSNMSQVKRTSFKFQKTSSPVSSKRSILKEPSLNIEEVSQNVEPGSIESTDYSKGASLPTKVYKVRMSDTITQALLEWIYTGETDLEKYSQPLLLAALRHGVPSLAIACQHYLASLLNLQNVCQMIVLSYKYEAKILKEDAMQFAINHSKDVTSRPEWEDLIKVPQVLLDFSRKV